MVPRPWQIVALGVACMLAVACSSRDASSYRKNDNKRNIPVDLHEGDIAFRRGIGAASRIVLAANSDGSYSHVGIVVEVDDTLRVVHEVPFEGKSREDDKIYSDDIGEFFSTFKAKSGAIYRLRGLDSTTIAKICRYAKRHLKKSTPFDHEYNLSDDNMLYCSELVWRCYLEAGIDITKGERTTMTLPGMGGIYILPSDIEINKELTKVYNF